MPPLCHWCGEPLFGQWLRFERRGQPLYLHLWRCAVPWIEVERALGRVVPGEPAWRPGRGRKR